MLLTCLSSSRAAVHVRKEERINSSVIMSYHTITTSDHSVNISYMVIISYNTVIIAYMVIISDMVIISYHLVSVSYHAVSSFSASLSLVLMPHLGQK